MQGVSFYNGMLLTTQDFQYLQTNLQQQIKYSRSDLFNKGIVSSPAAYLQVDLDNTLKVLPLATYAEGGERIDVYTTVRQLALDLTNADDRRLGTKGALADDQFGWEPNVIYIIAIKYIQVAGRPRPHFDTREGFATRIYSGFELYAFRENIDTMEEQGINPYIVLGSAIYSNDTLQVFNETAEYAVMSAERVGIQAGNTVTQRYVFGEPITVEDHIRAVGDPSFVSPTNPHGITPAVLGVDVNAVPQHEAIFHAQGLIGNPATVNSGLYTTVNARNLNVDNIVVYNFIDGELLHLNGITLKKLAYGQPRIFIDLEDEIGLFPDNAYSVYVNAQDGTIGIASQDPISSGRTFAIKYDAYGDVKYRIAPISEATLDTSINYRIARLQFAQDKAITTIPLQVPGVITSNFTSIQDFRTFGSINANNLQKNANGNFVADFPFQIPSVIFNDGTSISSGNAFPANYVESSILPSWVSLSVLATGNGRCRNHDNSRVLNLQLPLKKSVVTNWEQGDNKGGKAPQINLNDTSSTGQLTKYGGVTLHAFVLSREDGACDIGYDTDINALNLMSNSVEGTPYRAGFRYYRRIYSFFYRDMYSGVPKFKAISDGNNGYVLMYGENITAASLVNPDDSGYVLRIPRTVSLKVTLNSQNAPASLQVSDSINGYGQTVSRLVASNTEYTVNTDFGTMIASTAPTNTLVRSYHDVRIK